MAITKVAFTLLREVKRRCFATCLIELSAKSMVACFLTQEREDYGKAAFTLQARKLVHRPQTEAE